MSKKRLWCSRSVTAVNLSPHADVLFGFIERFHGTRHWGAVLDAGTGAHSLRWIAGLPTERWTAVTGDKSMAREVRRELGSRMRPQDRIVTGNWTDASLLAGERYDVVVADYLLGAVEGFAPFFQEQLFRRMRPHCTGQIYVVGLDPCPHETDDPWGNLVVQISRLRDVCIDLGGGRRYREFPMEWAVRQLEEAGFRVQEAQRFTIRYSEPFVCKQLAVGERYLSQVPDAALAQALRDAIERLREQALRHLSRYGPSGFGANYVICAQVAPPESPPESSPEPPPQPPPQPPVSSSVPSM